MGCNISYVPISIKCMTPVRAPESGLLCLTLRLQVATLIPVTGSSQGAPIRWLQYHVLLIFSGIR